MLPVQADLREPFVFPGFVVGGDPHPGAPPAEVLAVGSAAHYNMRVEALPLPLQLAQGARAHLQARP